VNKGFFRCSEAPQARNVDVVIERGTIMNSFSALSLDALAAELDYRRGLLAPATSRRLRRATRRAAR
jgi:hypothetical protein